MEAESKDARVQDQRPDCFGNEVKFVTYMETSPAGAECAECPCEGECGEFILLKCSRELIF